MITSELIERFMTFANEFPSGYLKRWKAGEMLDVWEKSVYRRSRDEQLLWVANCLYMEGFTHTAIIKITGWLRAEFLYLDGMSA